MFLLEGLAAVAAKIASASTLAQVATGVGITVAGVTGAGAAGILPGVVQDGVAGAVEAVSPFDLPDSADDRVTGVDDHRDEAETDDSGRDGIDDVPGADPTQVPVVSTPAAPSTSHETEVEVEVEVEAGDDDGIHQHRGGRATEPTSAVRTDNSGPGSANSGRDHAEDDDHATGATAPSTVDTPEVEDESDDDGGHHGGNSGSGSGSDDRDDDSSGHGGDDD